MGHCGTRPQCSGQYCRRSRCSQVARPDQSSPAQRDKPSFMACQGSRGGAATCGGGRGAGAGSAFGAAAGSAERGSSTFGAGLRRRVLGAASLLAAAPCRAGALRALAAGTGNGSTAGAGAAGAATALALSLGGSASLLSP